jgi:hypothetical protein
VSVDLGLQLLVVRAAHHLTLGLRVVDATTSTLVEQGIGPMSVVVDPADNIQVP